MLGIIIQLIPLIHCYPITELCIQPILHCIMHTTSAPVKLTIADHAIEMNQVDIDYPCYVLEMEGIQKSNEFPNRTQASQSLRIALDVAL